MKEYKLKVLILFAAMLLLTSVVYAGTLSPSYTDFEDTGFIPGESVHNHMPNGAEASPAIDFGNACVQAWFVPDAGTRDEEIVDVSGPFPDHGNVWRFSDAASDGILGQAPHSANSGMVHGETGASNDAGCGAPTTADFYAEFDFHSATGTAQPDYVLSISANSGDTRHAYVRIREDDGGGYDLQFFDTVNGETFRDTTLDLNLSYTEWHSLGIEIFFHDGLASGTAGSAGAEGNDVVNIYANGDLVHTGTTWESYVGARSVDRLLFEHPQVDATRSGGGLYIDNILITETCPPGNCVFDDEGPITSNVTASPNPVAVNANVTVTANVDDSTTGGSNIASAEYSVVNGTPPSGAMSASDSTFNHAVSEDVTASFTAPSDAGIYDLCVSGSDAAGNTGPQECVMLVVYDPDGGFVTGGGWIDSPAGAYNGENGAVRVDGNPDDGWTFNAEPTNVTPAGFTGDEASIGNGSLHVAPITNDGGSDPNAKFILRYVPASEIQLEDFDSFSIDFLIDDAGSSTDVNQFYVNFYTLTPDPDDGSWYDCRFDYIASSGSISSWTPLSFSGADMADAKGDNLGGTCPASPSDMPAGSTILFISVNLGDTSVNDTGVGGYFDNAQLTAGGTTTTWDFEPLAGKANFGFVSKYKKGASVPTGNTEFVFTAGDLNFHSSSYDWLVVTGSSYARFKGTGTINGEGDYKFMIWAGDKTGTNGEDTFRIKIWYEDGVNEIVVYDNGMDQEIGGGNIVVHTK